MQKRVQRLAAASLVAMPCALGRAPACGMRRPLVVLSDCVAQVNAATKLKAKAGRLQEEATKLLTEAKTEKEDAASMKAAYYQKMDEYSDAVKEIDAATANAQSILDQMNAQSLVLAQVATQYGVATNHGKNPDAAAAVALKAQLLQAQKDLATITAKKAQADMDTAEARKLADKNQPVIIAAEAAKRESDFHFEKFAEKTAQADKQIGRASCRERV